MFSVQFCSKKYLKGIDFKLVDALPQPTHGGSMRYVIATKNQRNVKISLNVKRYYPKYEKKTQILIILNSCLNFRNNCEFSLKKN